MLIRIGYDIAFDLVGPTPFQVLLNVHPSQLAKIRQPEELRNSQNVPISYYIDEYGNTSGRMVAHAGTMRFVNSAIVEDTGFWMTPISPRFSTRSSTCRLKCSPSCFPAGIAKSI